MKPPDRPAPGRTDRILGVMGGMLRACALPGQEGVRKGEGGGVRRSLGGFRTAAPHNSIYPQKQIVRGARRHPGVPRRGPEPCCGRTVPAPQPGRPFCNRVGLTAGRRGGGGAQAGPKGGRLTTVLSPQPPKSSPLGPAGPEPESACTEGDQSGGRGPRGPAWVPLPGKKLAAGWGAVRHPAPSGTLGGKAALTRIKVRI